MLNKKQKKSLFILDIIEFIFSVIAIIIFTLIFRLDESNIRYLFLLGDFYVIYSFSKTISSLETKIQKSNIKKSISKLDTSYEKKLSV